jgi:hypothetical protein
MIPRDLIRISPRHLPRVTARRVGSQHGLGALVSAFLRELGDHVTDRQGAGNVYLADAVVDMRSAATTDRSSVPIFAVPTWCQ